MKFPTTTVVAVLFVSESVAFQAPGRIVRRPTTVLQSAVAPDVPKVNGKETEGEDYSDQKAWECDEEANCVAVDACDEEICRTSLDVRIHNQWYDLSGWRKAHPAGSHWIDWYDGRDATEVMDGFHSQRGREMVKRLPHSKPSTAAQLESTVAPDSATQIAFRKLRDDGKVILSGILDKYEEKVLQSYRKFPHLQQSDLNCRGLKVPYQGQNNPFLRKKRTHKLTAASNPPKEIKDPKKVDVIPGFLLISCSISHQF